MRCSCCLKVSRFWLGFPPALHLLARTITTYPEAEATRVAALQAVCGLCHELVRGDGFRSRSVGFIPRLSLMAVANRSGVSDRPSPYPPPGDAPDGSLNLHETFYVKIDKELQTIKIKIQPGVRQGDPISLKIFTLALESVLKELSCGKREMRIDGCYLNNMRFADDIVLISSDVNEIGEMLEQLKSAAKWVGR
ncbi:hypothetical protein HUJ04_004198 [Dendroctonus ponderosae]|nr:hypothetical protein HUJ04_004198 [Dendroctonus ponderosae]